MRDQRDGGGLISSSLGFASGVGCSQGDGAGRVLRALERGGRTVAYSGVIAAIGRTTAVGAAPGSARVAERLA